MDCKMPPVRPILINHTCPDHDASSIIRMVWLHVDFCVTFPVSTPDTEPPVNVSKTKPALIWDRDRSPLLPVPPDVITSKLKASCSVPLSRNMGIERRSMESVPDGLNRDGYASSTSLLSNPTGRRWSIGKTVSERGVGDKSILGTVRRPGSSSVWEIIDIPRCCITLPYPVDGLTTSVKCHGKRRLDCPAWSWPSALARYKFDNFR